VVNVCPKASLDRTPITAAYRAQSTDWICSICLQNPLGGNAQTAMASQRLIAIRSKLLCRRRMTSVTPPTICFGTGSMWNPDDSGKLVSSCLLRRQQRNDLPPVPTVAAEIRVECEHLAIGVQFGEAHQACIGQGHWGVRVAAHQGFQCCRSVWRSSATTMIVFIGRKIIPN
jgi:hypothetical protein